VPAQSNKLAGDFARRSHFDSTTALLANEMFPQAGGREMDAPAAVAGELGGL